MTTEHKKYITYIVKYLGVALIAGSVVHVGTLHNGTARYIILGITGLVLMIIGNIIEAKQNKEKIDLTYLAIVTGLSLATGFLSGGIQHYLDNPMYAGYLLASGLFFSYIIFFLKDKSKILSKNIVLIACISALILFISSKVPVSTTDHHAPVVEHAVQPELELHGDSHQH